DDTVAALQAMRWPGNIRQLRNAAEQISVLETNREINLATLQSYLPKESNLPTVVSDKKPEGDFSNEREILYKVLFDMKSDLNDLKKLTLELLENGTDKVQRDNQHLITKIYGSTPKRDLTESPQSAIIQPAQTYTPTFTQANDDYEFAETIEEEEVLRLEQKEIEMIKKALEKNKGRRKAAAEQLGISERTLYRKIKQFDL
ncbi:MAG TPA: helix-turn-helix domain-containing protein, partial [Flavobacterium sp.]|nr:helix-turn-helix domain-containing protein [Flavobacterium sp.]